MEAGGRESYAPAAQRLDRYTETGSPEDLTQVADELLAVGALLRREPGLRRALTDPARRPADRGELLRGLLTGKVGDGSLGLVEELVKARWSSPGQLRDAVERLGAPTSWPGCSATRPHRWPSAAS